MVDPQLESNDVEEKDKRDTLSYWLKWIKAAKKASKRHRHDADSAWAEYENQSDNQSDTVSNNTRQLRGEYPIYWASCKVIEPALYARTPTIIARRRFDIDDPVAMVGSTIVERLGIYAVESCDFDDVMSAAVADFIHADKATAQVCYEADFEEVDQRVKVIPDPATEQFFLEDGTIHEGEVMQDELGFFHIEKVKVPKNQKVYLKPLCYDEVLHTPDAKNSSEIVDMAYYFKLDRQEAEIRFGKEVADKINYKQRSSKDKDDDTKNEQEYSDTDTEYVEGWECWSLKNKTQYWVSTQYQDDFLDIKRPELDEDGEEQDIYGLREYFPSTRFIINNKPRKSLYPTPVYVQLSSTIKELHKITKRKYDLIDGIRRRALVDGASDELIYALNSLEQGEFVAVDNLKQIVEKGGIENMVYWIPVQELVQAISELSSLEENFKNDFYEFFGVPDILRGSSDPIETATGQSIKSQSAHDRFKYTKKQLQQLARDSIEMMVDLMLGTFTDDKIAEIVGYQYMSPDEQQRFPEALAMAKDDESRVIRLDIETDSMSFVDEQLKASQMNQAIQTVTAGMKEIAQTAQYDPDFAQVSVVAVLQSLETIMPAGKEFMDGIEQATKKLFEKMENPPPPPPPPPDYEQMKLQIKHGELQLKAQAQQMEGFKLQSENAAKTKELQQKDYKLALDAQQQRSTEQIENIRLMLDKSLQDFMMQIEAHKANMEQQSVDIESFKAKILANEAMMEEVRLAREADAHILQTIADSQRSTSAELLQRQSVVPPPQVNVNVAMPKVRERRGIPLFDDFGNLKEIRTVEVLDDGAVISE